MRRSVPAFGPSGFGYFPDQAPTSSTSGGPHANYGPSVEFDAYMPGGGGGAAGSGRQYQRRLQHGVFSFLACLPVLEFYQ